MYFILCIVCMSKVKNHHYMQKYNLNILYFPNCLTMLKTCFISYLLHIIMYFILCMVWDLLLLFIIIIRHIL